MTKEEKQHRESEIQIRDSASNTGTTLAEAVRTDGKCSNWQSSSFMELNFSSQEQMKKNAEIAWERADKAEKENKDLKKEIEDLKKTVEKRGITISELNTELCNARAEAKANEIPEELVQEMYCMVYDKEAESIGKMERAADQMTEATIAGEDAHGFAEEYKKQKENRNRYGKVMEMLDQRERRRAGR